MQPRLSLPEQALDHLRRRLAAGEWSGTLPAERALADELRISRPTLRIALEQLKTEGWLRVEGRQTCIIRSAPKRHRAGKTRGWDSENPRIVFLSPLAIEDMPSSALIVCEELSARLAERGALLRVIYCPAMLSARPGKALARLLQDTRADGWILHRAPLPVQEFFESAGVPCALFGNPHPEISLASVSFEFAAVARHAGTTLSRLGHPPARIAVLISDRQFAGNTEVERGVSEALGTDAYSVLRHREDGSNLGELFDRVIRHKSRPTGFIVHRPTAALHLASRALSIHRLGIPADLSLICLEDSRYLAAFHPEIARYHHGYSTIARRLFDAISELVYGRIRRPQQRHLLPNLLRGSSLGPPPE